MSWISKIFNRVSIEQPDTPRHAYTYSGGSVVNSDTAMKVAAFYSGVIYISTSVAKLPWYIKDEKNKRQNKHPVHNLLNLSPNNEMDAMFFQCFLIQQAIIHGNGYAEIERDYAGRPKFLWPIKSNYVSIERVDGELLYRVREGSIAYPGEDVYLRPKDIFHIKNFHTTDGISGQGLVWYGSEVLGISAGADKFANSLFTNGGLPSGVLHVPGALSETAIKRLKEGWKSAHGGRKVGGVAILEEGAKYEPISHDPQVLQFLESRQFSVLEIARFLRVPPTKLYVPDAAKFNNIEQENLSVSTDSNGSWVRQMELQANLKLIDFKAGLKSEMDISAMFKGDMDTRSNYFTRMMQNAAMSANEIRESEGLEPYEGGDEFYIASNNFTPISKMHELLDAKIKAEQAKNSNVEDDSEKELNKVVVDYIKNKTEN